MADVSSACSYTGSIPSPPQPQTSPAATQSLCKGCCVSCHRMAAQGRNAQC